MERPDTNLKRAGWTPAILIGTVAVLLCGRLVLHLWDRRTTEPPPPAAGAEEQPPAPAGEAPPLGPPRADGGWPLLETVSSHELFRAGIEGDFIRRSAVVIDNLREGASPRRQLGFLAPARPFTASRRGGELVIDPASYRRYDRFAEAVASIDAQVLARVYGPLRTSLEGVYRRLGYPRASIDAVAARALLRIENAPIENGYVAVEEQDGLFVFRDRRLEQLRDVEKHLLRMGPRNTRLLQVKAREIRRALDLPDAGPTAAAKR